MTENNDTIEHYIACYQRDGLSNKGKKKLTDMLIEEREKNK